MEEAVWISVGVIGLLLGVAIVIGLFSDFRHELRTDAAPRAAAQLQAECDLVCDAPLETLLAIRVTLPRGTVVETRGGDRICAESGGRVACERCACEVEERIVLNLTDAIFDEHEFTCAFHRGAKVNITCQG